MTSNQLTRFMGLADATLADLFPAIIKIGGLSYQATGVGGSAVSDYLPEGGQAPGGSRFFRVLKAILPTPPKVGDHIYWQASPTSVQRLQIIDVPDRPHETSWTFHTLPADR